MTLPAKPSPGVPHFGLDRVLVGTDFSLDGDRAVRRAGLLGYRPRAQIILAHVLPGDLNRAAESVLRDGATQRLGAAALKLREILDARNRKDVTIRVRLGNGRPAEELTRLAETTGVELVVIGRRGTRTVRELLIGTTAQRVIGHGRLPVLVVVRPPRAPYRSVVIGFDLSPYSLRAAKLARQIVPPVGSVWVVHSVIDPLAGLAPKLIDPAPRSDRAVTFDDLASRIRRLLPPLRARARPWQLETALSDPRRAILEAARRRKADLIVLGSVGRTGIRRALIASVASAVLLHAETDVMIAPRRRQRRATSPLPATRHGVVRRRLTPV